MRGGMRHQRVDYTSAAHGINIIKSLHSSNGLLHYLHFGWKLVKASVEAFTASMEASMEDMEAMEASVEASMEDMLRQANVGT